MKNSEKKQVVFLKGDGESVPTEVTMAFFPSENKTAVVMGKKLMFVSEFGEDPRKFFPEAKRTEFRGLLTSIIAARKSNLLVLNKK